MNKKEAQNFQRSLCDRLQGYYQAKGYSLDRKKWNFVSGNVNIPLYLETNSGPFITIRPSFRVKNKLLKTLVNHIVSTPILSNGIFIAGSRLNTIFEEKEINLPLHDKIMEVAGMYNLKIYGQQDLDWTENWYKSYMEEIGWKLIGNFLTKEKMYKFYTKVFLHYEVGLKENKLLQNYRLDFGSHATMIFLGLRDSQKNVYDLIELTNELFPNSLFALRANEMLENFGK